MKLYLDAMRLLAGALSLASVAGLRASSNNDPLEVLRKLISSSNFDSAALKQSLGSLNSKLTQKHFEKQHGRHLETDRDCGEVIASVTLAEVQALLEVSVSFLLQDPSLASFRVIARQLLFSDVKYGFKAVKVCMSCEEALDVLSEEQLANSDPFSYSSYCSEEKYGYGAVSSSSNQISHLNLFEILENDSLTLLHLLDFFSFRSIAPWFFCLSTPPQGKSLKLPCVPSSAAMALYLTSLMPQQNSGPPA